MDEMDRDFWNEAYQEDPDHAVVEDHFLESEVAGLQPGRALDLGCGSGPNALMLARRGWSVFGVDWAERAIELASQAARDEGLTAGSLTRISAIVIMAIPIYMTAAQVPLNFTLSTVRPLTFSGLRISV